MAKQKINSKLIFGMVLYWALYLTITMALFELYNITPETVPGRVVGWMFIVEVPRVILGYLISKPIFKKY